MLTAIFNRKPQEPWTRIGQGVLLHRPDLIVPLGYPDSYRTVSYTHLTLPTKRIV